MGKHHLIMGETIDYISGDSINDTHDERLKQKIAKLLITEKGYSKEDIQLRKKISVTVNGNTGIAIIDFIIRIDNQSFAIIKYGPGSLVTRQRPALSLGRIYEKHIIPVSVVTNGFDAIVMDTDTGKVVGNGLDAIFSKKEALIRLCTFNKKQLTEKRMDKEQRILYAMEILTQRECDEYTCNLC